jgi:excisionase family DNA binding protein
MSETHDNTATDYTLTVPEAARRLGLSERATVRLLDAGRIAWRRPSVHRRVSESSLETWLMRRDGRRAVRRLPAVENVMAE